jgi:carbonic anhydrase
VYRILLLAAVLATLSPVTPSNAAEHAAPVPPDDALAQLMEGNKRFVRGESVHPHESLQHRIAIAEEQRPLAVVLTCSDSRVKPSLLFDQGFGDLFVVAVAGGVVGEDVAGSVEYAVDHLGTRLVLVLGHSNCGAVKAAYHAYVARDLKRREPHEIETLLMRIEPALEGLPEGATEAIRVQQAVERNVGQSIDSLRRYHDLRQASADGTIVIRGAAYDIESGVVTLLPLD